jgi:HAD superfamily hydrolase (TIGR01450 family)
LNLSSLRVFFFDLDGVLSVGKENPRYLGGRELIMKIRSQGKRALLLTNDSTHTREEIHLNLSKLGIKLEVEEILTSSYLTSDYLTKRFGKTTFFLVGEQGLLRELEIAGHSPTEKHPQVVVVGFDRQLSYDKLDRAMRYLRNGAALIGSYGGAVYMSDRGPALSAGPIIKALEYASGRKAIMIGKPSPRMFQWALRRVREKSARAVMIGDQIETDLAGARKARVHTILVLTGVENRDTIRNSELKPEMVIETVDELMNYL